MFLCVQTTECIIVLCTAGDLFLCSFIFVFIASEEKKNEEISFSSIFPITTFI